jgi:predicted membrane-bound spermidine synthase
VESRDDEARVGRRRTAVAATVGEEKLSGAPPAPAAGRLAVFVGVGLVSLSGLMLQLALTRLFSATMYYHFAFLAISLALFGSGAGGVLVYLFQDRLPRERVGAWLAAAAMLTAAATVFALWVVLASPLSPVEPDALTFRRLLRIYLASALPFLFAGTAIALAVTSCAREISRLYLFDLLGAALGCLLLIPAVNALGAVDTVLLAALASALAGVAFALGAPRALLGAALASALACGALLLWNHAARGLDVRKAKGLDERGNVIFSKWNSFSRVTVWGSLDNAAVHIMIDADAATLITRDGGTAASHLAPLAGGVEALAYRLRPGARALIMGPGGGNDVVAARLLGAREITAVELNPIIARDVMSSQPFKAYSGNLYEQPGVRLVVAEARSFLRRSREQYDVVQGTMVDTWAATAAGAYALAENNLYTVEAFGEYLERLVPGGILSLTRWYLEPPDQLLRLFAIARAALRERGTLDAGASLALVRGYTEPGTTRAPATFLLKNGRFTETELHDLEAAAARSGFSILYSPRSRDESPFARMARALDPAEVWNAWPGDVTPTRDDDPFFFHTVRLRELLSVLDSSGEWRKTNLGTFVLLSLLVLSLLLSAAFILVPLALVRGRLRGLDARRALPWLFYFACLGAGFIIVEVTLVQKTILFLGHPVHALTVVLFALLVWSGVGSRLSGQFAEAELRSRLPRLLGGVAALILLAAFSLSPLYDRLVHLDQPLRIAVAVAALCPLGLAMGMPMPTAIRILAGEAPELIPWGWGVNGAASVMGSVAALTIALLTGFTYALAVAAALYVAAWLLVRSQPA